MKFQLHMSDEWESSIRRKGMRPWTKRIGYMTEALYEDHPVIAFIPLVATNNGTQFSQTIDMSRFNRAQFIMQLGAVQAGGLATMNLQQTNNANGATNVNLLGSGVGGTNAVAVGTSANQICRIEVRADQMTRRYLQCVVVTSVNVINYGVIGMPSEARNHPAGGNNAVDLANNVVVA